MEAGPILPDQGRSSWLTRCRGGGKSQVDSCGVCVGRTPDPYPIGGLDQEQAPPSTGRVLPEGFCLWGRGWGVIPSLHCPTTHLVSLHKFRGITLASPTTITRELQLPRAPSIEVFCSDRLNWRRNNPTLSLDVLLTEARFYQSYFIHSPLPGILM